MKKRVLTLLYVIAVNSITIADDTQTRLKVMAEEMDGNRSHHNGSIKPIFQKTAPNNLIFGHRQRNKNNPSHRHYWAAVTILA